MFVPWRELFKTKDTYFNQHGQYQTRKGHNPGTFKKKMFYIL